MPGHADGAVAVVIPAYQAAATIAAVLAASVRALPSAALYVVDDGSRDGTGEGGRGNGATVLVHPRNLGKGAALRTGIDRALADGAAIVVTLDADGQHPPEEIPRLVAPIAAGEAAPPPLHELALRHARVAHRGARGAGRADRVPGARASGRRAGPPQRGALRLRSRVSARGPGAG